MFFSLGKVILLLIIGSIILPLSHNFSLVGQFTVNFFLDKIKVNLKRKGSTKWGAKNLTIKSQNQNPNRDATIPTSEQKKNNLKQSLLKDNPANPHVSSKLNYKNPLMTNIFKTFLKNLTIIL